MVDEGKGGLYLEGSGERKGFADGEVEAAFSLRLMAPEAGRTRSPQSLRRAYCLKWRPERAKRCPYLM